MCMLLLLISFTLCCCCPFLICFIRKHKNLYFVTKVPVSNTCAFWFDSIERLHQTDHQHHHESTDSQVALLSLSYNSTYSKIFGCLGIEGTAGAVRATKSLKIKSSTAWHLQVSTSLSITTSSPVQCFVYTVLCKSSALISLYFTRKMRNRCSKMCWNMRKSTCKYSIGKKKLFVWF